MKACLRILLVLAASLLLPGREASATPPFSGTVFLDPDIITSTDPTAFTTVAAAGQGIRLMFDRRVNDWVLLNAYLFNASYDDGLSIEIEVNPEFGSAALALAEAQKYGPIIGRLPKGLRAQVTTSWIHKGVQPFGGGNNNLLIHTGQADVYAASGLLEEALIHEASHTSLDTTHASTAGWLAAQVADPEYISTYARDNATSEDIAESFLPYFAVRYRSDRIAASMANTIVQTIPNRIAYFDQQSFNSHPIPTLAPFALKITYDQPAGKATLTWTSKWGKAYKLSHSTNLTDWQELATTIPSTGVAEMTTDFFTAPSSPGLFFRLREF